MPDDIMPSEMPNKLRAKFFKGDAERDFVEISIVGDPNTLIAKVTPEHVSRFPREWASHQQGEAEMIVAGTPLKDVPGIERDAELQMRLKGIRTAEELAGLDEAAAKSLGMGGLTFWKAAKQLLRLNQLEAMQALVDQAPRRGRPPKDISATEVPA